jgi:hypothetical protein
MRKLNFREQHQEADKNNVMVAPGNFKDIDTAIIQA